LLPERELAKRMGISRPLIREALSALHLAGIIESRAGDGADIRKNVGNACIETQVRSILEDDVHPVEVLEARESLEEGVVKLAAEAVRQHLDNSKERFLGNGTNDAL